MKKNHIIKIIQISSPCKWDVTISCLVSWTATSWFVLGCGNVLKGRVYIWDGVTGLHFHVFVLLVWKFPSWRKWKTFQVWDVAKKDLWGLVYSKLVTTIVLNVEKYSSVLQEVKHVDCTLFLIILRKKISYCILNRKG